MRTRKRCQPRQPTAEDLAHLERVVDSVVAREVGGLVPAYLAMLSTQTDELMGTLSRQELDEGLPAGLDIMWRMACTMACTTHSRESRVGYVLALRVLEQLPGVCEGLASRLKAEFVKYDPALAFVA